MIEYDKALHFMVGVLIYAFTHFIDEQFALLLVILAGVGKEIYDHYSQKGTPEIMDIIFTVAGGLTGYICSL